MKKKLLIFLIGAVMCLTACGKDKGEEFVENIQNSGSDLVVEESDYIRKALTGTWNVVDSTDVYELKANGIGNKNGDLFTFECGFNEDNKMTMNIVMEEDGAKESYLIATDSTGHGVALTGLNGCEDKWFLPANVEFLELNDERADGIVGEWTDANGNKYILDDEMGLLIKGKNADSEGTYSVIENEEGDLVLTLVVNGSALEFGYSLDKAKGEMTLYNYPKEETPVEHIWTK